MGINFKILIFFLIINPPRAKCKSFHKFRFSNNHQNFSLTHQISHHALEFLPEREKISFITKSVLFTKFNPKKVLCNTQVYYYCRNKLAVLMNATILYGHITIDYLVLFSAKTIYGKNI
jgi:hypothetical protein